MQPENWSYDWTCKHDAFAVSESDGDQCRFLHKHASCLGDLASKSVGDLFLRPHKDAPKLVCINAGTKTLEVRVGLCRLQEDISQEDSVFWLLLLAVILQDNL